MMSARLLILGLLVVLGLGTSLYKVDQWERAILFQFREVRQIDIQPGLHIKFPKIGRAHV